jgi:hypothetical protein
VPRGVKTRRIWRTEKNMNFGLLVSQRPSIDDSRDHRDPALDALDAHAREPRLVACWRRLRAIFR